MIFLPPLVLPRNPVPEAFEGLSFRAPKLQRTMLSPRQLSCHFPIYLPHGQIAHPNNDYWRQIPALYDTATGKYPCWDGDVELKYKVYKGKSPFAQCWENLFGSAKNHDKSCLQQIFILVKASALKMSTFDLLFAAKQLNQRFNHEANFRYIEILIWLRGLGD